jgi:hypothetical protein
LKMIHSYHKHGGILQVSLGENWILIFYYFI